MRILFATHHRRFKTVARSDPMARELARRGHQMTLLCLADREKLRLRVEREDGVEFVETPDLLPGKLRSGWDPWATLHRLWYLRDQRFDLVHASETRPATIYPVLALLRHHPAPLVIDWNDWWGRGGLIEELRPPWYRFLFGGLETYYQEHFRTRADALTVISSALGERAEGLGVPADRIFKISGGAEPDFFTPRPPAEQRPRFGLAADRFIVGFSAADVTMDTDLALAAVAHARRACPEMMLMMTGNRPPDLDHQIREAGLPEEAVRHLGFLPYADLPAALSCADAFLLPFPDKPANRGRWPHKIGAYMCLARPTVTNPVGEMRRLFEQEPVGLLAPAGLEAMGQRLIDLARDPALRERLGSRARAVATEQFAWPKVVDGLEACYRHAATIFARRQPQPE